MPMSGRNEWRKLDFIPPLPPKFVNPGGRPCGRPIRARRRELDEPEKKKRKISRGKPKVIKNAYQLKRQQKTLKCSQCGVEGHNKRACKMRDDNSKATQTEVASSEVGNQTPKFQAGERIFQDKQYQDGSSTERLISASFLNKFISFTYID
ncbi:PREDICTED: uncharacterized protein LOC105965781 [Erythranthe guttata]|uniref:uncharacterized protein LOC105965781 n=1 Tax=Erythranthe guttata TaxID=4155 RepID=UPI00064D9908|nr:PREDICTED: uncharacterized protein LOC105965781 [Erythranthe guttata]|eukprot:XP_012845793.1 PREDICTED: uncharacterized protein LOC105965781 [Erythranthe guttata]